jgi:Gpi18-like mannosyltransferase
MSLTAAWGKVRGSLRGPGAAYLGLLAAGTLAALLIRMSVLEYKSFDFLDYGRVWYFQIQHLGFQAFRRAFSNYNPPYLYVLYVLARFFPSLPAVAAIKIPAIASDFICAALVHKIVRLRYPRGLAPFLAYMAILLAPTVIMNSSYWGQAESLYAAGVLASLYGVLTRRPWLAMIAFGLALAFKLQAIFFLPFLLALWLRGAFHVKHILAVPGLLFLALIPAWWAGRPLPSLLSIYGHQIGQYDQLTMLAPNIYAWLPASPELTALMLPGSLILGGTIIAIYVLLVAWSKIELKAGLAVQAAALSALITPFVLPKMHERYFFLAEVLSIVLVFYVPSLYFIPVIVCLVGFFAYASAILGQVIPQAWLALAQLLAIVALTRHLIVNLYPDAFAPNGPDGEMPSIQE